MSGVDELELALAAHRSGLIDSRALAQALEEWKAAPHTSLLSRLGMAEDLRHRLEAAPLDQTLVRTPGTGPSLALTSLPERYQRPDDRATPELGRGGIGRVWLAYDRHLEREVALKELLDDQSPPGQADARTTEQQVRFLREARLTAQLEHPNIVPVHDLGQGPEGRLYYTMRRIQGRTLKRALEACASLADRLSLLPHFVDLCQAVAFAHARGVIHRDLKPENVMVGEHGETQLLDWGLAKALGEPDAPLPHAPALGADRTTAGSALGTPLYMSPEQAQGDLPRVDARSDVWSLGAMLYELLTGQPPFRGATAQEVMSNVVAATLVPADGVEPGVPRDLARVAARALQKAPEARYASASELTHELLPALTSHPLARQHPRWHLVAALLAGGALATALGILSSNQVARSEQREAEAKELASLSAAALAAEAESRLDARSFGAAEVLAAAALVRAELPEARGLLWASQAGWSPAVRWRALLGPGCSAVAFTSEDLLLCSSLGEVLGLDPLDGRVRERHAVAPGVWMHGLGAYGDQLVVPGDDRRLHVLSPPSSARALPLQASALLSVAGTGPDTIVTGALDGEVRLWRDQGRASQVLQRLSGPVRVLTMTEGRVAALSDDEALTFELGAPTESTTLPPSSAASFGPSGVLALGTADGAVLLWSSSGAVGRVHTEHRGKVQAIAWSPDGKSIASGAADGTVLITTVQRGEVLARLEHMSPGVRSLAWASDGRLLASASDDRRVQVFAVPDSPAKALPALPLSLAATPKATAVGLTNGLVAFPDAARAPWPAHAKAVTAVALDARGDLLLTGGADGAVRRWSQPAEVAAPLVTPGAKVTAVAIGGELAAWAQTDAKLTVWSLRLERPVRTDTLDGPVNALAFSNDGAALALALGNGRVELVDARSGEQARSFFHHGARALAVALSPDDQWLASTGADRVVMLSSRKGRQELRLNSRGSVVSVLAFAPDSQRLAGGTTDGRLLLWSLGSGSLWASAPMHAGEVKGLVFTGRSSIVSTGVDRRLRALEIPELRAEPTRLLELAQRRHALSLTGARLTSADATTPEASK